VSLRRKLLVNPEAFSHVKTLDPARMSCHEVYNILGLLLQGQGSGVRLFEFLTRNIPNSDVDAGPEISELPQSPETHREPHTTSPRDVGTGNASAELDNDISDSPGPAKRTANSQTSPRDEGSNSPFTLLSAPGTPAIEPPSQSSPPLSKSAIKVAIENVAEAGFLSITSDATTVEVPNQVLQHFETSQQGGKAKTGNSNSIKRGRKEMEQGGPSEDRQTKKHRGRVFITPREQSSRYDSRHIYHVY
jgi:hypothetical protein